MKNRSLLPLLAAAFGLVAFSQMNMSGKWVGHLVRPHTTDTATFTFDLKQTNDVLTGTATGPGGGLDIDSGKVVGNNFSFVITQPNGQAKVSGTYYADSLGTNVALPNGHQVHMKMLRSK